MNTVSEHNVQKLVEKKKAKLFDVRSPVDFAKGSLPPAQNLVLRNISKLVALADKKDHIVFFGNTDAKMAAQYAFGMGYTNIHYVETLPMWGDKAKTDK
jgi:rhodanese-related sulfurtransferase